MIRKNTTFGDSMKIKEVVKILLSYWLEIIVGILILFIPDSIRWFLLYFFVIFLVVSVSLIEYLRKLILAFQVANEIKLLATIRKLKITEDELSIVIDSEKMRVGEETWREMEKELNSLIL